MNMQRHAARNVTREELAERYRSDHDALLSRAVRVVGDPDLANHVVHVVFTRLLEYDHKVPRGRLCAYIHRAVHNEALHRVTRRQVRSGLHSITQFEQVVPITPDIDAAHRRLALEIHSSIGNLPPRCRQAATLVLQRGLTLHEAAAIMGTSVRTVKEQLRRARKRLRTDLAQSAEVADWRFQVRRPTPAALD